MKQKTITLSHCELLVVEISEPYFLQGSSIGTGLVDYAIGNPDGSYTPIGNSNQVEYLGAVDEVSEEQAAGVVVYHPEQEGDTKRYVTATKALHSLLTANGVVFDAGSNYIPHELGLMSSTEHLERALDVLDRRSKVWDKERAHIFIKEK